MPTLIHPRVHSARSYIRCWGGGTLSGSVFPDHEEHIPIAGIQHAPSRDSMLNSETHVVYSNINGLSKLGRLLYRIHNKGTTGRSVWYIVMNASRYTKHGRKAKKNEERRVKRRTKPKSHHRSRPLPLPLVLAFSVTASSCTLRLWAISFCRSRLLRTIVQGQLKAKRR